MKKLIKPMLVILLSWMLTGCSTTGFGDPLIFTTDPDYGYSPQEPLALYSPFEEESSRRTAELVQNLRTAKGEKLMIVDKTKVENPNYKEPRIVLYNWITGEQINQGNGRFLTRYELQSESGGDPLNLFVNHEVRGQLRIPGSLHLARDRTLSSLATGE